MEINITVRRSKNPFIKRSIPNLVTPHVNVGNPSNDATEISSIPSSIDKILDTINKLLDSENTELTETEQELLEEIDNEVENL